MNGIIYRLEEKTLLIAVLFIFLHSLFSPFFSLFHFSSPFFPTPSPTGRRRARRRAARASERRVAPAARRPRLREERGGRCGEPGSTGRNRTESAVYRPGDLPGSVSRRVTMVCEYRSTAVFFKIDRGLY